jgi:uncharacterized protein DUF6308
MCIDIPGELRDEDSAVGPVRAYFADDPATGQARYWGAHFERLGGGGDLPEVAYQIKAEDLLAVSMLIRLSASLPEVARLGAVAVAGRH